MTDDILLILTKLGYSPAWLQLGLVDSDFIREQARQIDSSDDKNTEHYRYAAFRSVLTKGAVLDTILIENYIRMAQIDTDRAMARSALLMLLQCPSLTDAQLEHLANEDVFAWPNAQRIAERERLLRQFRSLPITDEFLGRCIASGDAVVQRALLESPDI